MRYILGIIGLLIFSFGITALLVKGICWAFGLAFSLKIAFGVWLILLFVRTLLSGMRGVE